MHKGVLFTANVTRTCCCGTGAAHGHPVVDAQGARPGRRVGCRHNGLSQRPAIKNLRVFGDCLESFCVGGIGQSGTRLALLVIKIVVGVHWPVLWRQGNETPVIAADETREPWRYLKALESKLPGGREQR